MRSIASALLAVAVLAPVAAASGESPIDYAEFDDLFEGQPAAFVVHDARVGAWRRYDAERCARPLPPFSTYKIPNSLIALETGVVTDPHAVRRRDAKKRPEENWWPRSWRRDQSLRDGFHNSAVWLYQDVALAIGEARMQKALDRFDYGNRDQSSGLDRFWLNGSLLISADQQIEFLRRFYDKQLGLSARTDSLARALFVVEETPEYRLSAKTGLGATGPDSALGWYVGYLERDERVYFFALNLDGPSTDAIRDRRVPLARAALARCGLLPEKPK